MKYLVAFLTFFTLTSCSQDNYTITNKSIGGFKLNKKTQDIVFNKESLEITLNSDEMISSIIVRSNKYKTSEGFGVGTSFNELKKGSKKWTVQELKLNKGTVIIGDIGNSIIYDEIIFVDTNNDKITDFVWITNN